VARIRSPASCPGILAAVVFLLLILVVLRGADGSGPSGPDRDRSEQVNAEGRMARGSARFHPPPGPHAGRLSGPEREGIKARHAGPGL
jgi:hypothetical protein